MTTITASFNSPQQKFDLIEKYVEQNYGQTADEGLKAKLRNAASVGWELSLYYKGKKIKKTAKTDKWIKLKNPTRRFKNSSWAAQVLEKMEVEGKISNYRISWDTQLRMVVEVKK